MRFWQAWSQAAGKRASRCADVTPSTFILPPATFDESRSAPAIGRPSIWVGVLAPAALSEGDSAQLHRVVTEALGTAAVRQAIDAVGGAVPSPMSLVDAARFYAADTVKLQALAKAAQVEPL